MEPLDNTTGFFPGRSCAACSNIRKVRVFSSFLSQRKNTKLENSLHADPPVLFTFSMSVNRYFVTSDQVVIVTDQLATRLDPLSEMALSSHSVRTEESPHGGLKHLHCTLCVSVPFC